ncbi:hypothetical protein CF8_0177 [Aeromonas phage CF8]|nr:hypothetical protein CF8_0177 [Aeromonas phage CF8]
MNIFDIVEAKKSNISNEDFQKLWDTVTNKHVRAVLKEVSCKLGDRDPNGNEFSKANLQSALKNICCFESIRFESYKESAAVLAMIKVIYEQALYLKDPDVVYKELETHFEHYYSLLDKPF